MVASTLRPYDPELTRFLVASAANPLTPARVTHFLRDTVREATSAGCEAVVVYYVGHMLVNAGSQLALLQGGATSLSVKAGVASLEWPSGESVLPLEQMYLTTNEGGIPFLLLVDGCMESGSVPADLATAGFTFDPMHPDSMHYTGSKEILAPGDFEVIEDALAAFGKTAPYLSDTNPVIFAAKPGTYAVPEPNPFSVGGPPLAPLAAGLHQWTEIFRLRDAELPSLRHLLDRVSGWRGVGQIGMSDGISWSQFEKWNSISDRIRPGGFRSRGDCRGAIVERLTVPEGYIETISPGDSKWPVYLLVHRQDDRGINRWSVQRFGTLPVQTGQRDAVAIVPDVVFGKMAFGDGELHLQHEIFESGDVLFERRGPDGSLLGKDKLDTPYREVSTGFAGTSILAIDADNVVDNGGDKLLRRSRGKLTTVAELELTAASCIVEFDTNRFAWIDTGRSGFVQVLDPTKSNTPRDLHIANEDLSALAHDGSWFLALNRDRTRLYRGKPDHHIEATWLLDAEDRPLGSSERELGGMLAFGGDFWLAADNQLLRLDLSRLEWEELAP